MSNEELADLLARCAGAYHARVRLSINPESLTSRCRDLNSYGVLSVRALGAIFDVSEYRIEQMLGDARPKHIRGGLNPKHLSILAYALSNHQLSSDTLKRMLAEGTSIATIARLTNVSEATLYRRLQ